MPQFVFIEERVGGMVADKSERERRGKGQRKSKEKDDEEEEEKCEGA